MGLLGPLWSSGRSFKNSVSRKHSSQGDIPDREEGEENRRPISKSIKNYSLNADWAPSSLFRCPADLLDVLLLFKFYFFVVVIFMDVRWYLNCGFRFVCKVIVSWLSWVPDPTKFHELLNFYIVSLSYFVSSCATERILSNIFLCPRIP